MRRRGEKSQ
uniref:Uncharacterized protein n=1 Tax=Rhizophora mucronata TaxID=61149 RepID=A0A2P2QMN4_RHIMU